MTIIVAIISPYASVRAGLQALLADFDEIEVAVSVSSTADLAEAEAARLDVVLVDLSRQTAADFAAAAQEFDAGLVLLADDSADIAGLIASPIRGGGYISREAEGPEIAGAIHAAAAGLITLDRNFVRDLPSVNETLLRGTTLAQEDRLTGRELEVLQLLAQGLPNKTIAARLNISQNTAKFHVAAILAKLGAASRTEAVTLGARQGLITL